VVAFFVLPRSVQCTHPKKRLSGRPMEQGIFARRVWFPLFHCSIADGPIAPTASGPPREASSDLLPDEQPAEILR
jgi:hypothetical protein